MGARRVIPAQGPGRGREICWCKAQLLMFSPPLQPGKLKLQRQTCTEKPNSPLPGSSRFNASNWLCLAFPGTSVVGVSYSQRLRNSGGNLGGWRQQSCCRGWQVPSLGTRAPCPHRKGSATPATLFPGYWYHSEPTAGFFRESNKQDVSLM